MRWRKPASMTFHSLASIMRGMMSKGKIFSEPEVSEYT